MYFHAYYQSTTPERAEFDIKVARYIQELDRTERLKSTKYIDAWRVFTKKIRAARTPRTPSRTSQTPPHHQAQKVPSS
jgi:hypothetical protein